MNKITVYEKDQSKFNLADLFFLLTLLWINAGFVRVIPYFNILVMFSIFVAGVLLSRIIYMNELRRSGLLYGVLFLMSIILSSLFVYHQIESESFEMIYGLMILYILCYLKRRPKKVCSLFVFILLIDCIIINLRTFTLLTLHSELSRLLSQGSQSVYAAGFSATLLAGYGHIYASAFALIYIASNLDKIKKLTLYKKIVLIIYIITSIVVVIRAQFTFAIIWMVLGIILAIVMRDGFNIRSFLLIMLCSIFGLMFLSFALDYLISTQLLGFVVTSRLTEIQSLLNGNLGDGDILTRLDLYFKTIRYLPKSIILGVFESHANNFTSVLGMHTEWLDRLAMFGIIRYSIYLFFLSASIKYSFSNVEKQRCSVFIICFLVLGFVNTLVNQNMYLLLYIIVPFLFCEIIEN